MRLYCFWSRTYPEIIPLRITPPYQQLTELLSEPLVFKKRTNAQTVFLEQTAGNFEDFVEKQFIEQYKLSESGKTQ